MSVRVLFFIISSFSVVQRSQVFDVSVAAWPWSAIFHAIWYGVEWFFRSHIFLASSVDVFLEGFLKLCLWLLYRVLNFPSVSPM